MTTTPTVEARLRQQIGRQVRKIRVAKGLTQTQLGAKARKEQGTISRIESGDYAALTIGTIIDLAYGLDVDPGDLFEWPIGVMHAVAHEPGRAEAVPA